jgi:hypothetical protein
VVFAVFGAQQALAAGASGTVLAVVQQAHIDSQTGEKILEQESPVYSGDKIETGPLGQAQIKFRDNTKLVVGPNSSMVIDAFVFNDDNTARQISINVVKGALRFFTGNSRKDAYKITTPTAAIGVRGTQFDIAVEKEGTTRIANFEGMTRICHRNPGSGTISDADCVESKDPCTLSISRPNEPGVTRLNNKDVEYRNRQLKYYFKYIRDQSGLLPDFKVDLTACQFTDLIVPPGEVTPGEPPVEPPPPPEPPLPEDRTIIPPSPPVLGTPVDRSHDRSGSTYPTHN